jgi:hypothetical protein
MTFAVTSAPAQTVAEIDFESVGRAWPLAADMNTYHMTGATLRRALGNPSLQRSGLRERKKRQTRDVLAEVAVRLVLAARYVDRMVHAADALCARPAKEPLWEAIVAASVTVVVQAAVNAFLHADTPAPAGVGVPPVKRMD